MIRSLVLAALGVALSVPGAAVAQLPTKEPAKPAAAAKDGPLATVNGVAIPRQRVDVLLRERAQQGHPDSEQLRNAIREELINREIIQQEASRSGLTKKPELQLELELVRQSVIVQTYLRDWVQKHPVTDAEVQKEYDRVKAQTGEKEYKARHILVATEDEAKALLAEIRKGAKFEDVASRSSKDDGTKSRGGDLDWTVPTNLDRSFAEAMIKLEKGKMTEAPVRSRFGFHLIQLDDVRAINFPPLAQVKPQLTQRLAQQRVQDLVRDLRAKAKVE